MNNSQSTEYRLLELGQLPRVWGGGEGQWLEAWGGRARKQGGEGWQVATQGCHGGTGTAHVGHGAHLAGHGGVPTVEGRLLGAEVGLVEMQRGEDGGQAALHVPRRVRALRALLLGASPNGGGAGRVSLAKEGGAHCLRGGRGVGAVEQRPARTEPVPLASSSVSGSSSVSVSSSSMCDSLSSSSCRRKDQRGCADGDARTARAGRGGGRGGGRSMWSARTAARAVGSWLGMAALQQRGALAGGSNGCPTWPRGNLTRS